MITKSDFMLYANCPKQYWLTKNKNDLAKPISDDAMKHIEDGKKVGELARQFLDNTFIATRKNSDGSLNIEGQIEATKLALANGYKSIAEASFQYKDLFCAVDLLKVDDSGGYSILEVKATNAVKEDHFEDIAFQKYVLEHAGLKINGLYILHLNHAYERHGDINPKALLIADEVTYEKEVTDTLMNLEYFLDKMRELQAVKEEFEQELGPYCKDCPFHAYCHKDIPVPTALNINGVRKSKAYKYINEGIYSFADLLKTDYAPSNLRQKVQIEAEITGKTPIISQPDLKNFLNKIKYPLYHLDFETYSEPIPPFDGARPYQVVPFQYSLDIELTQGGKIDHREFLADKMNAMRELAEQLCKDIPMDVTSIAFNATFEKTVLKHLAEQFPDLSEHLLNIRDHIVDLAVPFLQGYYFDIKQGGSNSIKYVMPALCPHMEDAYHNLPFVHNGGEAMTAFPQMMEEPKDE